MAFSKAHTSVKGQKIQTR